MRMETPVILVTREGRAGESRRQEGREGQEGGRERHRSQENGRGQEGRPRSQEDGRGHLGGGDRLRSRRGSETPSYRGERGWGGEEEEKEDNSEEVSPGRRRKSSPLKAGGGLTALLGAGLSSLRGRRRSEVLPPATPSLSPLRRQSEARPLQVGSWGPHPSIV